MCDDWENIFVGVEFGYFVDVLFCFKRIMMLCFFGCSWVEEGFCMIFVGMNCNEDVVGVCCGWVW